jgi:hypothetical protein
MFLLFTPGTFGVMESDPQSHESPIRGGFELPDGPMDQHIVPIAGGG